MMHTTLEVLNLTQDLEMRSYSYRLADKHTEEDNFLRDFTPCLVLNSYRRFKGSYCLRVQRRSVMEDRKYNAFFCISFCNNFRK